MSVKQLSVFTQSKPGHLVRILDVFEKANVSIVGFCVADTGDYGIARFILDKPDIACEALREQGFAYAQTDVICLRLGDSPGILADVMRLLKKEDINVLYSYSMIETFIVIYSSDVQASKRILNDNGYETVSQDALRG